MKVRSSRLCARGLRRDADCARDLVDSISEARPLRATSQGNDRLVVVNIYGGPQLQEWVPDRTVVCHVHGLEDLKGPQSALCVVPEQRNVLTVVTSASRTTASDKAKASMIFDGDSLGCVNTEQQGPCPHLHASWCNVTINSDLLHTVEKSKVALGVFGRRSHFVVCEPNGGRVVRLIN